jgi:hypothetical protein
MRANQPAIGSAPQRPRHTYSSSYARDYADLQDYHDYLARKAQEKEGDKQRGKEEYNKFQAQQGADNMLRHDDNPPSSSSRDVYRPSSSSSSYTPSRAPYAYTDYDEQQQKEDYRRPSSSAAAAAAAAPSSSSSTSYSNPSRYHSTSRHSYIP